MNSKGLPSYYQPKFYKFSSDSIILAKEALKYVNDLELKSGLDLCAGCGVVGFEFLLNYSPLEVKFDFCELQEEFKPYFFQNLEQFKQQCKIINGDYNYLNFCMRNLKSKTYKGKYDFIISNPPYFESRRGKPSHDRRRHFCRTFEKLSHLDYFEIVLHCLSRDGLALISLRPSQTIFNKFLELTNSKNKRLVIKKNRLLGSDLLIVF